MNFNDKVKKHTPPTGGADIFSRYFAATGNSPENLDRFKGFLAQLAEAESYSGKAQSSDKSTASGYYHYLDDSTRTSDNRIKNLLNKHNVTDPDILNMVKEYKGVKAGDRPKELQDMMVLADLTASPTAPLNAWKEGKVSNEELYYKGHHTADPNAVSSQDKVYENWNNAGKRLQFKQKKQPDPQYDFDSAIKAGMGPDETGHWSSRDPKTGLILKAATHPTFHKTVAGEDAAGYKMYQKDGRIYSFPKDRKMEDSYKPFKYNEQQESTIPSRSSFVTNQSKYGGIANDYDDKFDAATNYKEIVERVNGYKKGGRMNPPPGFDIKNFTYDYIKSPKYLERLKSSNYNDPDKEAYERRMNVMYAMPKYGKFNKDSHYDHENKTVNVDLEQAKVEGVPKETIMAHEYGHAELDPGKVSYNLRDSGLDMRDTRLNMYDNNQLQNRLKKSSADLHDRLPDEQKSDLNALRYELFKNNIYDAKTQDFNSNHLEKLNNSKLKDRLLRNYNKEDLIWLMNNIAQSNETTPVNMAAKGGMINSKADGGPIGPPDENRKLDKQNLQEYLDEIKILKNNAHEQSPQYRDSLDLYSNSIEKLAKKVEDNAKDKVIYGPKKGIDKYHTDMLNDAMRGDFSKKGSYRGYDEAGSLWLRPGEIRKSNADIKPIATIRSGFGDPDDGWWGGEPNPAIDFHYPVYKKPTGETFKYKDEKQALNVPGKQLRTTNPTFSKQELLSKPKSNRKGYDLTRDGAADYETRAQYRATHTRPNGELYPEAFTDEGTAYRNSLSHGGHITGEQEGHNAYNEGGLHEQNPHGGIPQGMGSNGKMNTVEEGETSAKLKQGKFIFSNRIQY